MAALVKKKGEIATAVEQYALDGLHVASESLGYECLVYLLIPGIA
jgi:hypothetical protein